MNRGKPQSLPQLNFWGTLRIKAKGAKYYFFAFLVFNPLRHYGWSFIDFKS
jgi:hypothetical protein